MTKELKKSILICQPTFWTDHCIIPYLYMALKSYSEQSETIKDNFLWLDPIVERGTPDNLLENVDLDRIDVLGLSCYEWNWSVQRKIAKKIKARNPNCLVVVGGPQPKCSEIGFFKEHPYFDLVVLNDGEAIFKNILMEVLKPEPKYHQIPGVLSRESFADVAPESGACSKPNKFNDFLVSPILDQTEFLEEYCKTKHRGRPKMMLWETNRGCPFGCSFCDWGSSTMSRMRQIPFDRLVSELACIANNKIEVLFILDSNFGMFDRDVQIANQIAEQNKKTGFPKFVIFLPAKKQVKNNIEIARIFHESNLTSAYVISLQHNDPEVLSAIRRINPRDDQVEEMMSSFKNMGIPYMPQLIIGCPGDTVEKWKRCLTHYIELGVHDEIRSQNFALLPNAPAANASYIDEWQIECVQRYTVSGTERRRKDHPIETLNKTNYIVSTKTYDRNDWAHMHMFDTAIKTLHFGGLTKLVAIFLRFSNGVGYYEFYDHLIRKLFVHEAAPYKPLFEALWNHRLEFLENEESFEEIDIVALSRAEHYYTTVEWLFYYIGMDSRNFFEQLKGLCVSKYGDVLGDYMTDVVDYQEGVFIDVDYDIAVGRKFQTQFLWPSYFKNALDRIDVVPLALPSPMPQSQSYDIRQTHTGYGQPIKMDWFELAPEDLEERSRLWLHRVMGPVHLRARRNNFNEVLIKPSLENLTSRPSGRPEATCEA